MATGIIIQARMTSKRFPGKSMALLFGKPVVQHVIERALKIKSPDTIKGLMPVRPLVILAIPDKGAHDLFMLAEKMEIESFLGSEHNVLDRYYQCAKWYGLKTIMRLTGDCPFISPAICSEVLAMHKQKGFDYTSNVFPKRTFPQGFDCEVMTFDALEAAWILSRKAYNKEHVTPILQNTPEVRRGNLLQKRDDSALNLCIDYPEDIARVEMLVTMMKRNPKQRGLLQ